MHRQIEVHVIVVVRVGPWRQHGREDGAGARLHLPQESLLLGVAPRPSLFNGDAAAIGEAKGADIHGVAEGMFREAIAAVPIDGAAGIGAHGVDLRHGLAEASHGDGLHHLAQPVLQRRRHGAVEGLGGIEGDRALGQRRHLEGRVEAADARPIDGAGGLDIGRFGDPVLREAGLVRLGAPGRAFSAPEQAASRQKQGQTRDQSQGEKTSRHPLGHGRKGLIPAQVSRLTKG